MADDDLQSLVVVFARLLLRNTADTINFLDSIKVGDQSALVAVMSVWADNSTYFYGRHTNKIWCGGAAEAQAVAPVPLHALTRTPRRQAHVRPTVRSGLAIIQLFQSLDPRLLSIQVKQQQVDQSDEIVTRSKAKQRTARGRGRDGGHGRATERRVLARSDSRDVQVRRRRWP